MKHIEKWIAYENSKGSRVWLGILILLTFVSITTTCVTNSKDNNDQIYPLDIDDYQSVGDLYPLALEEALAWCPDASLEWVSTGISQTTIFNGFSFQNESDPSSGLNVYIVEEDHEIEIDNEEIDNLWHKNNPISIVPDELTMDSFDALEIALAAGGREFLRDHPFSGMNIQLRSDYNWNPGIVLWRVYFSDHPFGRLDIFIHPDTGEVLRVDEI